MWGADSELLKTVWFFFFSSIYYTNKEALTFDVGERCGDKGAGEREGNNLLYSRVTRITYYYDYRSTPTSHR